MTLRARELNELAEQVIGELLGNLQLDDTRYLTYEEVMAVLRRALERMQERS